MDLKLARGRVNKLLLEVVIDLGLNLIVKTSILYGGFVFTLRIDKSNPPQVFILKLLVSLVFLGHHIVVFFIFSLLCHCLP